MAEDSSSVNGKNGNGHNGNGNGNGHGLPLEVEVIKVNKGGRPTLWSDKMLDQIYACARTCMSRTKIAAHLQISYETFREWSLEKPEINEAIARGHADFENWALKEIARASLDIWEYITDANGGKIPSKLLKKGDWYALAWILQRLNPKDWGKNENLNIEVKPNSITQQTIEEIERRLKIM